MNRIKQYVPRICLKSIYHALIHSYLNYGILSWGYDLKKVTLLEKKAIRTVTNSHDLCHTDPLFKNEKILKVYDIFKMHCLKLYYDLKNMSLSRPLSDLFTIDQNTSHNLILFDCSDRNGKDRIRYHLPRFINSCPPLLIHKVSTHSLQGFKNYAKNHFLQGYDDSPCQLIDCYSCLSAANFRS